MKTIGYNGVHYFRTHPHWCKKPIRSKIVFCVEAWNVGIVDFKASSARPYGNIAQSGLVSLKPDGVGCGGLVVGGVGWSWRMGFSD